MTFQEALEQAKNDKYYYDSASKTHKLKETK